MDLRGVTKDLKHVVYFCTNCITLFVVHLSEDGKREEYPINNFGDSLEIGKQNMRILKI